MNNELYPKKNLLKDFIYLSQTKPVKKEVINGLFRFALEALIEAQYHKSLVLMRLKDTTGLNGVLQRLGFIHADIYSFSDKLEYENLERENIWDETEFLVILSPRYSVVLIWDYSTEESGDSSVLCYMLNSRTVNSVVNIISGNSKIDLMRYTKEFTPERRSNETLNNAVNKFINFANSILEENIVSNAENSILEANTSADEKYRYISRKSKSIAHDVRNHVSIIELYSKIANKRVANLPEETKESISHAVNCILKSSGAVSQLLSELRTIQPPNIEELDAGEFISTIVSMVTPAAEEKNIVINLEKCSDCKIMADENKLINVLINLIYNSIDAIEKDGSINIKMQTTDDNMLKISVTDTGCGIEPKEFQNIFKEGYTTKTLGNGLGLYISKENMKELYGDLILRTSDKHGTTFDVLIPKA